MSTSRVEAFLEAKWKSRTIEMENGSDEERSVYEQRFDEKQNVSSSNHDTPTRSPQTQQNTNQRKTEKSLAVHTLHFQKEITAIPNNQETSFTRPMISSENLVPISCAKTANPSKESSIKSMWSDNNKNESFNGENDQLIDVEVIQARPWDSDFSNDSEEEVSAITPFKRHSEGKVNIYEMTGDVWGLLEQQNEENELEEEEEEEKCAAQPTEEAPAEPVDMVFGALNSEDMNKINKQADSKRNQVPTVSVSGVPKMAIPFSNFGKLLEQSENEVMGDALIPKKLYDQGLINNSMALHCTERPFNKVIPRTELIDKVVERVLTGPQLNTKPTSTTIAQEMPHQRTELPGLRSSVTQETEPDSTTKFRQNLPTSGANQHFQTNQGKRTQTAIIETNLNQRLLPPRAPHQNHVVPEVRNPVLDAGSPSPHDPEPGPVVGDPRKTPDPDTKNEMLPISRYIVKVDPLAKTVTYNIVKYFQNRKKKLDLNYSEVRMASEATGMAKTTISKILAEAQETLQQNGKPVFGEWTSKKLPKRKLWEPNVKRDCIARMFIHNSYLMKKEVPTLKKIIKNSQENGFEKVLGTSPHWVKAHLKKLGFEYNARSGKKAFLIERPDFIAQRIRYLEEMQKHRSQQRNIVFVFITDMLKKGLKSVEWEGWDGVFHEDERGIDMGCVSVLHAASTSYVFHECLQVIKHEVNSLSDTMQEPFIHWLTSKLLPEVPKGSVVVLGDRRFNQMVDAEKRPHVGFTKQQIADWLRQHNARFDDSWPKALLLERAQKICLDQKYLIDDEITALGHIPVHMPLHHRDLNPLSFIWQDIKDKLDKTPDLSNFRTLRTFAIDEFTKGAVKLGKAWTQVEKLEKSYYNIDMHTDDEKEQLILRYGDGLVPIDSKEDEELESSDDDDNPDKRGPPTKKMKTNP